MIIVGAVIAAALIIAGAVIAVAHYKRGLKLKGDAAQDRAGTVAYSNPA